jgi:hypothetical protein
MKEEPPPPPEGKGSPSKAGDSPAPTVTISLSSRLQTLKHDPNCQITIDVQPLGLSISDYRIEIRRASAAPNSWVTLASHKANHAWHVTIAGKFIVRGIATIEGKEHTSAEEHVEVQFPSYAEIAYNATVKAALDQEWKNTIADCTAAPNQRRERGFWVLLNTKSDSYEMTATVTGAFVGPEAGAEIAFPARPNDNPAAPSPSDEGATYAVASFHTHTPTTYRGATAPPGATRAIGPSGADQTTDNADDVPGIVYDYSDSPVGSGSIPLGHPLEAAAELYHSWGRARRTTPP